MKTIIRHLNLPADRRVLVASDIHGNLRALNRVLEKAGFCENDILILEGDYIERCGENLATLRRVMELCALPNVYALTGNVDFDRWRCFMSEDHKAIQRLWNTSVDVRDWYGTCLLFEMCDEIGLTLKSAEDLQIHLPLLRRQFRSELAFIRQLPTVFESEHYIFVHGGLPADDLTALGEDPFPYLKNDAFVEKGISFDRWLVAGHWPCSLYRTDCYSFEPYVRMEQHIIANDGGCGVKAEGQVNLTVLDPAGGPPLTFYSADNLPVCRALEHQDAVPDRVVVSWVTRHVRMLQRGEEFSTVLHEKTGLSFQAPNVMLYDEREAPCCRDTTDGCLAVEPGDTLKLILKTSRGILAKKDSRVGWYFGKIGLTQGENQ